MAVPKKDVFPNLICRLNFLKTPEPQLQYQVVHGKQEHAKKEPFIDDERGGHGAEATKWLWKRHFENKNGSWNGIFQTKMALFIDERGDGAEADDVVVEEEWLPPWQELPMTERNDKSAPTGNF